MTGSSVLMQTQSDECIIALYCQIYPVIAGPLVNLYIQSASIGKLQLSAK